MNDQNNVTFTNNSEPKAHSGNSRTVKTALILLAIFILILILFLFLIRNPTFFGSFAQSETSGSVTTNSDVITPQSISYDNSYLFASPLKAAASVERVRITAYILDGQGIGVAGKQVILGSGDVNLHIYTISQATDSSGRSTFDISSDKVGLYTIEASVDGKKLNQKVTVSFN